MLLEKLRREERMWGGGFELKGQRGGREERKPETRPSPQKMPAQLCALKGEAEV